MTVEFVTPVGRIVWGHPARVQTKKDNNTKQPVLRDGKPVQQWVFGVAFSKAEFNQFVMPYLQQEAATIFPHGVPPTFSWKYKDGDGVDRQGKPYNTREGYAGNFVLTISTEAFAPPIYKNEGGRYRQLDEKEIKCGDFVAVKINAKANAPQNAAHTPGIYVNPMGIELVGYGQEIINASADPDEMFGGRTYNLPPGATLTPQVPQGAAAAPYNAPQQPATGAAAYAPPGYPVQPAPAPVQYAAPVQQYAPQPPVYAPQPAPAQGYPPPAHDFVQNAGQPQAPAQYAPQPAPVQYAAPVQQYAPQPPVYAPQPAAPGNYPPGAPTGR